MSHNESFFSKPEVLRSVDYLASDFEHVTNGIELESVMHRYIADELIQGDDISVDEVWAKLRQVTMLDDDTLYNNPAVAIEHCRSMLVTDILPLYRQSHTAEEFQLWAPRALAVSIVASNRHNAELCPRDWEGFEYTCRHGHCPVKGVVSLVEGYVYVDPLNSLEYLYEPQGEYDKTLTLIKSIRRMHIISEGEEYRLQGAYHRRYTEFFSYTSDNTLRTGNNPV